MGMRRAFGILLLAIFALATPPRFMVPSSGTVHAAELVEQAKLDALVRPWIDGKWLHGVSIGLINPQGTQTAGYGQTTDANPQVPDAHTLFEIGSVSKVFTGLLLADAVQRGEVTLNEPVQRLLGESITMPKRDEREITLLDLATHSSALPRMPSNFMPKDINNPYADYSVEQMGKFISAYKLKEKPGTASEYSNLGMGLLGHALALKAGMSYEALLEARICGPLSMPNTRITLDDARRALLASGHDYDGQPAANWDIPTLAGAGAIRSNVEDMLKFVAACAMVTPSPLDKAIALTEQVHFENPPNAGHDVGLAWMIRRKDHVVWHNGQTGGYHAYVALSPDKRAGIVLLSSTAMSRADELGEQLISQLLTGNAKPSELPQVIALDSAALEPLVGKYLLTPQIKVSITQEGDQLFLQLTGQPKLRFYPESDRRFFCRVVAASVSFEAGDDGKIRQLVIHQNGQDLPAPREQTPAASAEDASATEKSQKPAEK